MAYNSKLIARNAYVARIDRMPSPGAAFVSGTGFGSFFVFSVDICYDFSSSLEGNTVTGSERQNIWKGFEKLKDVKKFKNFYRDFQNILRIDLCLGLSILYIILFASLRFFKISTLKICRYIENRK